MNTLKLPAYVVSVVMVVYRKSFQATDILNSTPLYLQWEIAGCIGTWQLHFKSGFRISLMKGNSYIQFVIRNNVLSRYPNIPTN